ncbi:hypothetical protein FOVSG1_001306 [Fusarium oxysporum f. sp. vasinfectum]
MESESEYFVINVNLYLVQSSARTGTKIMALQDWDQNKAHEKNKHSAFSVVETILPVSSDDGGGRDIL